MTREEAIKRLKEARFTVQPYQYINEALDTAINALEQEDILDKIREEIMSKDGLEEALEIIDKYRAESEEEE